MIACVLIPRFALLAAIGERRDLLGRPLALAPEPGRPQVIGEVSGRAEAFGIHPGTRLAEALSRCPELVLVPPDADRAEAVAEEMLTRLEGIGAAVEPGRAGEAFFATDGLRGLWGGVRGALAQARGALDRPARLGAGPSRLCAHAAALRSRPRRVPIVIQPTEARAFLTTLPVGILRDRLGGEWERASLPDTLERLGVRTLGDLAALPDVAVADRFGTSGLEALRMARGSEEPLRPRVPGDDFAAELTLPEAASGQQLERALELLCDRLLANPVRRGRSIRRLRLAARLAGGGSWRAEVALRRASASAERLRLAASPKLGELPGPAASLTLRAVVIGPPAQDQESLARSPAERRRERLGEAVRQVRAAAGKDAVLRVLEVDPRSRVPERRALLSPFPDG
jgi:protein ImuB